MTEEFLLEFLAQRRIILFLDGGRLRYRAPRGSMDAQIRAILARHRAAIIERLRKELVPSRSGRPKCLVCDRHFWIDEPPTAGRIRTTCGKCGRFIGYRPAGPRKPHPT